MRLGVLVVIIVAVLVLAQTALFYRGAYVKPFTKLHDVNITIPIEPQTKFEDVYNVSAATVLLDRAHNNSFKLGELAILLARIAVRQGKIELLEEGDSLKDKLSTADSFVIISPETKFSEEEIEQISNFSDTKKLLLLADPGRESEINSLAIRFGFLAQNSYLYNLLENDGNFRHIFLRDFVQSKLTAGLNKIVLYVACPIIPTEDGIVFADERTFSSTTDVAQRSTPAVLTGNILAICDQTFLTEPYNSVADNNKLISNIADWLVQ